MRERALSWIAGDPDPETREQLAALLERGDTEELEAVAGEDLAFGTAGLRGEVGPGPNRMNRAVVIRATRGLADHLLAAVDGAIDRGVVVGFDARPDSERFAHDVVTVLAAAGLPVAWFPTPVPTPLVAWCVRDRNAAGAVVVTASHNPPKDNGYKVYDEHAVQISPPTDVQIAERIEAVGPVNEVPGVDDDPTGLAGVAVLGADEERRYLEAIGAARPTMEGDRDVPIVLTPLHGVGGRLVWEALTGAGFTNLHRVDEQWDPDGTFPTVDFPNPEEPGALDGAFALADEVDAQVVLANDPDADRLAVAVRRDGGWQRFTGDEVGCLLADHLLSAASVQDPLVVSSVVSSGRLEAVAALHDARVEQTLTGFKWIWRAGRELADESSFVLGYEEALGYSVGEVVRDKDGIAAAVVMADLVASLAADDRTLLDALATLDERTGRWANVQRAIRCEPPAGDELITNAVKRAVERPPRSLGDRVVESVQDLATGGADRPAWLPEDSVVIWHLEDDSRVLVRPSGTEPKLKVYVDLRLHEGEDHATAADFADAAVGHLNLPTP